MPQPGKGQIGSQFNEISAGFRMIGSGQSNVSGQGNPGNMGNNGQPGPNGVFRSGPIRATAFADINQGSNAMGSANTDMLYNPLNGGG